MDIEAIRKSYRRYAQVYDFYFGAVFQPGRKAVINRMGFEADDRVLEVGVGTGLSLPLYPAGVEIVGIDISAEMLDKARLRKNRLALNQVELHEMDAESMLFPDNSFDKVVAMYVASVVPHPARLVAEMRRVCKPGGDLFIVNHFHSSNPVLARLEKLVAPMSKLMGFRPDFSLDSFLRDTGLEVLESTRVNFLGYWTLMRARNNKRDSQSEAVDIMPVQAMASR